MIRPAWRAIRLRSSIKSAGDMYKKDRQYLQNRLEKRTLGSLSAKSQK
jgi:hypothetical protein